MIESLDTKLEKAELSCVEKNSFTDKLENCSIKSYSDADKHLYIEHEKEEGVYKDISKDGSELKSDDIGLQRNIKEFGNPSCIEKIRQINRNVEKVLSVNENILKNSPSDLDLQKVDRNLEKYKGTIFENQLKENLKKNFEQMDTKQKLVETEYGGTKPDIVLIDAKQDIKINDLEIKKGDNLFIEAKCGSDKYIKNEMGHMLRQVEGHKENSLVIVTKEYQKISPQCRVEFENALKEKGSHIYVADINSKEISLGIKDGLKI